MKKYFLFLVAAATLSVTSCTDEKKDGTTSTTETKSKKDDAVAEADVPAAVVSAFKAKYPNAAGVEWETAKENDQPTFKAKWKMGNDKLKAEFAQDGAFIKEEKD